MTRVVRFTHRASQDPAVTPAVPTAATSAAATAAPATRSVTYRVFANKPTCAKSSLKKSTPAFNSSSTRLVSEPHSPQAPRQTRVSSTTALRLRAALQQIDAQLTQLTQLTPHRRDPTVVAALVFVEGELAGVTQVLAEMIARDGRPPR